MWDKRYSSEEYAYGTEPNDFLAAMLDKLPEGKVLCLAEGEGRNAVWLAQHGHHVTAIDASEVGLEKARRLAETSGVEIATIHADLADFEIKSQSWDVIVSIFCHLPSELRRSVHRRCVEGLKSGGVMLVEAYTLAQLEYKTGGPPTADMMMDADSLRVELAGLELQYLQENIREVHEGEFHNGIGAVVQAVARKP